MSCYVVVLFFASISFLVIDLKATDLHGLDPELRTKKSYVGLFVV